MKLSQKDRPEKPAELLRMLKDIYQWPYPEYMSKEFLHKYVRSADSAYDEFDTASRKLIDLLPPGEGVYGLSSLLEARVPPAHSDTFAELLVELNSILQRIKALPPLEQRVGGARRGRPTKRPDLRPWVIAVFWYVERLEVQSLRLGFDDEGISKSRVAALVRATLKGMGLQFDEVALSTELTHANSQNLDRMNFCELIPGLRPPRTTPKPA